jgi:hypothetical protein
VTLDTTGTGSNISRIRVADELYTDPNNSNQVDFSLAGLNNLRIFGHAADTLIVDNTATPALPSGITANAQSFTAAGDPAEGGVVTLGYGYHGSNFAINNRFGFTYSGIGNLEIDGGTSGESFYVGDGVNSLDWLPSNLAITIQGQGGDSLVVNDNDTPNPNKPVFTSTNPVFTITGQGVTRDNNARVVINGTTLSAPTHTAIGYSGITKVEVDGGSSKNTFNVQAVAAGTPVTIKAGTSGDTINVGNPADPTQPAATSSLAGMQDLLTVHGQGNATLNVNDQGTTSDQEYDILDSRIDWAPFGSSTYTHHLAYDGLANLVLNGASAAYNLLGVAGTAAGTTTVVNGHTASARGTDEFSVAGLDYSLDGIRGNLNLNAQPGSVYSFIYVYDSSPWDTGSHIYTLSSPGPNQNQLTRTDMQGNRDMGTITYQGADEEIFSTPYRGGQVINVEGNAGAGSNFMYGISTIVLTAAGDMVNLGRPNPNGSGRLLDQIQDEVSIQSSNYGAPTINIDDSGDAVAKQATLDTSSYAYNITGLAPGTIYLPLYGGGTVHVLGGFGGNVFKVNAAPTFGLTIDGGAGANWLDYSGYGSGVTVNLQTGTATGLSGISRIQNVVGSLFDDTLTGGQANSILVGLGGDDQIQGGSGRNILIGGQGSDTLTAGGTGSILLGGYTAYDTQVASNGAVSHQINYAALDAIMAEWASSDSLTQREQAISNGVGSGNWALNAATVFDDGVADTLIGNPAIDWFFAGRGDTVL